jgi:anti-sigma regulatory factor (Ser/Thr protein kinase)
MSPSDVCAPEGGGLRSSEIVDGELELILNNSMDSVDDGRRQILRFLESRDLNSRVVNRLEVIFEEVVSNIVRYGFAPQAQQSIRLRVASGPDAIALTFEDDGVPFNPLETPEPDRFTSIDTAKVGGLGVALVRRLSSSVGYERIPPCAAGRTLAGRPFEPRNRLTVTIATTA